MEKSEIDKLYKEHRLELIKALMPFAKLGARLSGNEFKELYSTSSGRGIVKITMDDLKYAQHVLGIKDTEYERNGRVFRRNDTNLW